MFKSMLCRVESMLRRVVNSVLCGIRTQLVSYPMTYGAVIVITVSVVMPGAVLFLVALWLLFAAVNVMSNAVRYWR